MSVTIFVTMSMTTVPVHSTNNVVLLFYYEMHLSFSEVNFIFFIFFAYFFQIFWLLVKSGQKKAALHHCITSMPDSPVLFCINVFCIFMQEHCLLEEISAQHSQQLLEIKGFADVGIHAGS